MFWWHHAAELVRDKKAQQFGFITTNSIHQTFNRRCLEAFLNNDKNLSPSPSPSQITRGSIPLMAQLLEFR